MKRSLTVFCVCMLAMAAGVNAAYAEEPVKITIASHITPKYEDVFPPIQRFTDRINELGKGKVQAQLHHSESLFKVKELVPGLMNGACDIIFHTSSHTVETWPELGGLGLPFLYKDESDCRERWMAGKPLLELVNKEMNKKYGVKIMASGIFRGMVIATRKKAVEKPEDMKGLRLRSTGKIDGDYVRECGGIPLFLPSSQMNEALKKEAIDGVVTYPGTIVSRKLEEDLDYITETKPMLGAWGYQIYILSKTFDKLPEEIRDIVTQAASEYDKDLLEKFFEYERQKVKPILEKKIKYLSPNADQMKQFIESAQKTYAEWSKTVDPEFAKKFIELSQQ